MTASPPAVDDTLFARAKAHFTADELVELMMLAAWGNTVARYNHAVGVESLGLWRPAAR